jgi:voltage-gated potassium channel
VHCNLDYCWFGDITPITPLGQFIASIVMIMGYGIIAVPTGIVTAEIAKSEYKRGLDSKSHHCMNCGKDDHGRFKILLPLRRMN